MVLPAAHRRGRRWLPGLLVALCVLAAAGAVAFSAGWVAEDAIGPAVGPPSAGSPQGTTRTTRTTRPTPPAHASLPPNRWERVLRDLDRSRARAFASRDPTGLVDVYLRGSTVLRRDRVVLEAYARRGFSVRGAWLRLLDVRVEATSADQVALRVVDRLGPVRVRSDDAPAARSLPRDHPTLHLLRLVRTAAGWRIATVRSLSG